MIDSNNIGENIKRARENLGTSQRKFAEFITEYAKGRRLKGISHTVISNIERGAQVPSPSHLRLIANALGLPVTALTAKDKEERDGITFIEKVISNGGDLDLAEKISDRLLEKAESDESIANAFNLKGKVLLRQNRYRDALSYFNTMLEGYTYNNINNKVKALSNISLCYYHLKEYSLSQKFAIQAFENATDIEAKLKYEQFCATLEIELGNYERALRTMEKLLLQYREMKMVCNEIETIHNIAELYYRLKKYDDSLEQFSLAHNMAIDAGINEYIARTAIDLSGLYRVVFDQVFKAKQLLEDAIATVTGKAEPKLTATLLYQLSNCYEWSDIGKKNLLQEAYEILKNVDPQIVMVDVCESLGKFFEFSGDMKTSLMYTKISLETIRKLWGGRN